MPSLVQVSLQRNAPGPWGLRLQGGVDFEKALVISHVTDGSPSNMSGLMVKTSIFYYRVSQNCFIIRLANLQKSKILVHFVIRANWSNF